jgi:hypothetical protein
VEAALAVAYVVKVCGNFVGFAGAHWTGKVNLRDGVDLQWPLVFLFPLCEAPSAVEQRQLTFCATYLPICTTCATALAAPLDR